MIEFTTEQMRALEQPEASPPRIVNPETCKTFVILPLEEYERLIEDGYDDGPWSDEERDLLRLEACDMLDSFGKNA